jgi:CheY-like chemotaxis protein
VRDTGIGITEKDIRKLFQPFVQVESSLNRHHEGTGLGLALVQKLTDLHGGSVSVESEVGKGSCFTINLPCDYTQSTGAKGVNLPAQNISRSEEASNSTKVTDHHGVILLAEDHMANIITIGEYLESYNYKVVVAHDGLEALAKTEECNPDLILMDVQMPAMNGLEAIAHLRADPRFVSTPIIALTALAMPGDRERCLQVGANEYLSKPVSLKMLLKTIENLLDPDKNSQK